MKILIKKKIMPFTLVMLLWGFGQLVYAQKSKMEEAMNKAEASGFSGVVWVAHQGKPIFTKAVGFRSFENQIPLQTSDVFEMASISKQFTAMLVMMCIEKGLLGVDDLAETYLDIPYTGISVKNLLTHTSGLPDYQAVMDKHWDKSKIAGNPDILEYLRRYNPPMEFQPGEKYEYSNTGYVLLASIVEKVTGRDFVELSREWIFKPLGMSDTDIRTLDEKAKIPNFAAGHQMDESGQFVNANKFHSSDYTVWLGNRKGPGRVSSTAADLMKWDRALYTTGLVSTDMLDLAYSSFVLNDGSLSNYGFGWDLSEDPKMGKVVSHTGSNPGYSNLIVRYIDKDFTFIMLNNNEHESRTDLEKSIREAIANW
ncbi:serine hydrolase domain-containing protein [Shivajiella indica]|uniref:Serine hydrolase domain-containing protein n=1 Tax=Shivajiella indica TaxID=872115 RepID=A0ABW5BBB1_9BACT